MADQGKGKGEHISQIVIVLITAVVGPIAVWYTTSPNSPINASHQTPPALTATLAASPVATEIAQATVVAPLEVTATKALTLTETAAVSATLPATVTATATSTVTTVPTSLPTSTAPPTPTATVKPSGKLPAGTPVVVDGLSLLISSSDFSQDGSLLRLQVHLANLSTSRKALTFMPSAITLSDNTGKTYAIAYGDGKSACKKSDLSIKKTVQIEPGKELVLQPLSAKDANAWCSKDKNSVLPFFTGPLTSGTQSLTVSFNGLGPFKGFSIEITQ